jgi:hypothetical protein
MSHAAITAPWRTSKAASAAKAFTRVDLLAIVAGVVLLGLTLLPALARTSAPAQRSVCTDNLRRLSQAVLMYAADNRDNLPYPNWGNSFSGWVYTPVAGAPPNLTVPPYATNILLAYQTGLLWPFVKSQDVYRCPLDGNSPYYVARANKVSTYVMNGAVCGYGTRTTAYTLSRFAPSAYCFWEPDESFGSPPIGAFAYNDASSYPDRSEGPGRQHPGGTPIGTFGGTVEWVSLKAFLAAQQGGPNNVWCNPGTANGH